MVEKKKKKKSSSLLHGLALLLFLACLLLPLAAAPLSRSLALRSHNSPVLEVDDKVMKRGGENFEEEVIARMELESNDYPGSGANNRHDPKIPPPARP